MANSHQGFWFSIAGTGGFVVGEGGSLTLDYLVLLAGESADGSAQLTVRAGGAAVGCRLTADVIGRGTGVLGATHPLPCNAAADGVCRGPHGGPAVVTVASSVSLAAPLLCGFWSEDCVALPDGVTAEQRAAGFAAGIPWNADPVCFLSSDHLIVPDDPNLSIAPPAPPPPPPAPCGRHVVNFVSATRLCQNGGSCDHSLNSGAGGCLCVDGYTGDKCSSPPPSATVAPVLMPNGRACTANTEISSLEKCIEAAATLGLGAADGTFRLGAGTGMGLDHPRLSGDCAESTLPYRKLCASAAWQALPPPPPPPTARRCDADDGTTITARRGRTGNTTFADGGFPPGIQGHGPFGLRGNASWHRLPAGKSLSTGPLDMCNAAPNTSAG